MFELARPTSAWQIPPVTSSLAALATARRAGISHPLVAQVLLRRGLIGDRLHEFLHPDLSRLHDPLMLNNLEGAVRVVDEALRVGRKIVIYGDYDVDGTTSTALLTSYLRSRGGDVGYYIPMRNEGYGLSRESLDRIIAGEYHDGTGSTELKAKPQLIITVDCGTSSRREVDYARSQGVEVVVTDHHMPTPGKETTGLVVNPWLSKEAYPNWHLAGVGVAYKLVAAHFGKHPVANLDFVALGTVADVMPLAPFIDTEDVMHDAMENRILVKAGLERLSHPTIRKPNGQLMTKRPGLAALLAKTSSAEACPHGYDVQCFPLRAETIGFQIGPRINAIGRMGLDPNLVVELLITEDAARGAEIASLLDETNLERKEITNKLVDEAIEMVDPADPVIVLQMDLFKGVAGLVAGRLANDFGRPTIIIDAEGHGSARSVKGFDLLGVLQSQYSHLVRAAGHAAAMGISGVDDVTALRKALQDHEWPETIGEHKLVIDAVCELSDLDMELARSLARIEPTGQENNNPIFAIGGAVVRSMKLLNDKKTGKPRHVKLMLADPDGRHVRKAMWFNAADRAPAEGARVDVALRVSLGRDWYDKSTAVVELLVVDMRPSEGELSPTLVAAA